MAIFGPMVFAKVTSNRQGGALKRRGQGEWAIITNPTNLKFKDVAWFRGKIFRLCNNGTLMHCEHDEFELAKIVVFAFQPQDVMQPQNVYLIESSENLYGVFRYRNYIPSKLRHETQW